VEGAWKNIWTEERGSKTRLEQNYIKKRQFLISASYDSANKEELYGVLVSAIDTRNEYKILNLLRARI
jgi:hypothetical protein